MKKHIINFLVGICYVIFPLNLLAQSSLSSALTLEQATKLALEHNKKLQLQSAKVENAHMQVKDLKNEKLPDINFISSFHVLDNIHQYEEGWFRPATKYVVPRMVYQFTLESEMPIYLGGKIKYDDHIAELKTEVQELQYQRDERAVKLELILAYLNGLHLHEQQILMREKMHEDTLVINQITKMRENGTVTQNDVLRAQLLLTNHQMMYSELCNEYSIVESKVKTIIGLEPELEVRINLDGLLMDFSVDTLHLESLINYALGHNENYLMTEKQYEISLFKKKLARANYMPQITANAEYGYKYPNFMFFPPQSYLYSIGTAGVNLRLPISNFYKNNIKMKMAKNEILQSQIEISEQDEQIRHDVYTSYMRFEEAGKKIKMAEEAIRQAEENYRIVRVKYGNQHSLITELIDADNSYLEAQTSLISLRINQQLKYYQLQFVLGKL